MASMNGSLSQRRGWTREEEGFRIQPTGGRATKARLAGQELCPFHPGRRHSQPSFIAVFKLVKRLRTSEHTSSKHKGQKHLPKPTRTGEDSPPFAGLLGDTPVWRWQATGLTAHGGQMLNL